MSPILQQRLEGALEARQKRGLLRTLNVWEKDPGWINLADNDYLALSQDPAVAAAAHEAVQRYGCSSSASPLISGYQPPHLDLERELCGWHGFPSGLVWNSGYSANQAVLGRLPQKGDIVFADRLIHNSMIHGILQSGARLVRYRHNDLNHLKELLQRHSQSDRVAFVATESLFSMDGDSPDLRALVALKRTCPFCLILDEAHATGWYGPAGAGLASETGTSEGIDILVGTCGKALGSQGAYTLFHDPRLREYFINESGEFIYSTYLSPGAAGGARAAISRVRELSVHQADWRETSRQFRALLRDDGWEVPDGDSPIVPVLIGDAGESLSLGAFLREQKILAGVVRPPTVPSGTSRVRFSIRISFSREIAEHVVALLGEWRAKAK